MDQLRYLSDRLGDLLPFVFLAGCAADPEPQAQPESRPQAAVDDKATEEEAEQPGVDVGDQPLAGGATSMQALGEALVAALNNKSEQEIRALMVSEQEYKTRLFPALVNHKSALKMGPDLVWRNLAGESDGDLRTALQRYGGQDLQFVRFEPQEVVDRPEQLRIHRNPVVVVRGDRELVMLGPVIEHVPSGTWEILAFRDTK